MNPLHQSINDTEITLPSGSVSTHSKNKRESPKEPSSEDSGDVLKIRKLEKKSEHSSNPTLCSVPKKYNMYTVVPKSQARKIMADDDEFYYLYSNYWKAHHSCRTLNDWDICQIDQSHPNLFGRLKDLVNFSWSKCKRDPEKLEKNFQKHPEEFQPIASYIHNMLDEDYYELGCLDCAVIPYGLFKAGFLQIERDEFCTHFLSINQKSYQMMLQGKQIVTCLRNFLFDQDKNNETKLEVLQNLFSLLEEDGEMLFETLYDKIKAFFGCPLISSTNDAQSSTSGEIAETPVRKRKYSVSEPYSTARSYPDPPHPNQVDAPPQVKKRIGDNEDFYYLYNHLRRSEREILHGIDKKIEKRIYKLLIPFPHLCKEIDTHLDWKKFTSYYSYSHFMMLAFQRHPEKFQAIAIQIHNQLKEEPELYGKIDSQLMPYGLYKGGFLQIDSSVESSIPQRLIINKTGYQTMVENNKTINFLREYIVDKNTNSEEKIVSLQMLFSPNKAGEEEISFETFRENTELLIGESFKQAQNRATAYGMLP